MNRVRAVLRGQGVGAMAATESLRDGRFCFFGHEVDGVEERNSYRFELDSASGECADAPYGYQLRRDEKALRKVDDNDDKRFEIDCESGRVGEAPVDVPIQLVPVFAVKLRFYMVTNSFVFF